MDQPELSLFDLDPSQGLDDSDPIFQPVAYNPPQLRDYQLKTLDAFKLAYHDNDCPESLISLATGMGKTITGGSCASYIVRNLQGRILWVTHRTELLKQSAAALERITGVRAEIEQADSRAKPTASIVVASVQTLKGRRLRKFQEGFTPDLIIFDEAHHSLAHTWTQIKLTYPSAKVLNLTATPFRGDIGTRLELGRVLAEYNTTDGINLGVLVPPKLVGTISLDLNGVKKTMGDYDITSLTHLLTQPSVIDECATLAAKYIPGHKAILFAASVEHGKSLAKTLRELGIWVGEVYGDTPQAERDAIYEYVRTHVNSVIVNNLVCTEGLDIPEIDLVLIFRPTTNAALYLQMLGRGLRIFLGKKECLVIDAVDTAKKSTGTSSLYLPSTADVRKQSALLGKTLSKVQTFFSWFYWRKDLEEYYANGTLPKSCFLNVTAKEIMAAILPSFKGHWTDAQIASMAKLDDLIKDTSNSKDAFTKLGVYAGTRHVESLVSCLLNAGYVYCPSNKLPGNDEDLDSLENAINDTCASSQDSHGVSLAAIAKLEPGLQNFILNILGENNMSKQASQYYDIYPVDDQDVVWYKIAGFDTFSFINDTNRDAGIKTYWIRYKDGTIHTYSFKMDARGKFTKLPTKDPYLLYKDLPSFVKSTGWAKQPATPQQITHVAKILNTTPAELSKTKISRLSASALMSQKFAQYDLAILKKMPTPAQVTAKIAADPTANDVDF